MKVALAILAIVVGSILLIVNFGFVGFLLWVVAFALIVWIIAAVRKRSS